MKKTILVIISLMAFTFIAKAMSFNSCQFDSDCTLVNSGDCCGNSFAVNKKFSAQYNKVAPEECKNEKHACANFGVHCLSGTC